MRTLIIFLLLAVCFLGGVVFGMDRDSFADEDEHAPIEENKEIVDMTEEQEEIPVESSVHQQAAALDEPVYFTQKLASFLGSAVRGFYEGIVQVLYFISEQFF